jgi:hypothetical protein
VPALRNGEAAGLDHENVAEELDDLARSVRRELQSGLELILAHMLKWTYQPAKRSPSWENTLLEQRERVADLLAKNPSLKSVLDESLSEAYRYARGGAGNDMDLVPREWRRLFPMKCPWTPKDILNPSYLPKSRAS